MLDEMLNFETIWTIWKIFQLMRPEGGELWKSSWCALRIRWDSSNDANASRKSRVETFNWFLNVKPERVRRNKAKIWNFNLQKHFIQVINSSECLIFSKRLETLLWLLRPAGFSLPFNEVRSLPTAHFASLISARFSRLVAVPAFGTSSSKSPLQPLRNLSS